MRESKNVTQNRHFKQRVWERYGIEINSRHRYDMLRQIQSGQAQHLMTLSHSRTVFIVNCQGMDIKVIYDKTRKTFRTALPFNEEVIWETTE